jgi:branched-chain amino acid transport system ATP-binding protein
LPAQRIALAGGRTFQTAATFASMTARENVQLALLAGAGERTLTERLDTASIEADALLASRRGPLAERLRVAFLRRRQTRRARNRFAKKSAPRLLLMDEPTAGTAPRDRASVMDLISALVRDSGVATLFTEHDVDVVFRFAARVIVLDRGRIIADGSPASVRADPRVQAAYLGTAA